MSAIDLAIFSSRVESICDEMGAMLRRSAFSPNIKDRLDFSCAIFCSAGGLVAQAAHIPVHLGSMAFAMKDVVLEFDWKAGDIVIFNDPFLGGTHLPDVTLVSPVLVQEQLVAFVASRAHHANIGATTPGSMPVSRHLREEGVLISPVRLFASGVIVPETLRLLLSINQSGISDKQLRTAVNEFQRIVDDVGVGAETAIDDEMVIPDLAKASSLSISLGDFLAQLAAVGVGGKRLSELIDGMSIRHFSDSISNLNYYASQMTLAMLAKIPAGQCSFQDEMDDDGIDRGRVCLSVLVTTHSQGIVFDFTGTSAQVRGNINCPLSVTAAAVFYVVRCLLPPQLPACAGMFEHITILAEKGSLLNAVYPAAVAAGNVETSSRVVDLVTGALGKVLPEKMPAASQGTMNNVALGGESTVYGKWDYYETLCGGLGAHARGAGLSARHSHMTNTLNTPVESLEAHYPLRVLDYSIRKNSGGKGKYCGGDGVVRTYQFLENSTLTLLTERRRSAPWGIFGGRSGSKGINRLNGRLLPSKYTSEVCTGDILMIETPGGGGCGVVIPE